MNAPIALHFSIPPEAHTLAGFRQWVRSDEFPEEGRVALLGGKLWIDMSPERAGSHNSVKKEISRSLENYLDTCDLGKLYVDGMWITNEQAELSTVPDALFVFWETLENGTLTLIAGDDEWDGVELQGTPDWTLEVVSPTSEIKDVRELPQSYFAAGVKEYWLVDARGAELLFEIYVRENDGFRAAKVAGGWQTSEVFGCDFQLTRQRDRAGGWKHRLSRR